MVIAELILLTVKLRMIVSFTSYESKHKNEKLYCFGKAGTRFVVDDDDKTASLISFVASP